MNQHTSNPGLSTENSHCSSKQKIQISAECSTKKWWMTISRSTNLSAISEPLFLNFRSVTTSMSQVCTNSEQAWREKSKKTKFQFSWNLPTIKLMMPTQFNLTAEDLMMTRKMKKWNQLALAMIASQKSMCSQPAPTSSLFRTPDLPSAFLPLKASMMTSTTIWWCWARRDRQAVWSWFQEGRQTVFLPRSRS